MVIDTDVILHGNTISLIPLEIVHNEELFEALKNPEVWKYTWREVHSIEDMNEIISTAIHNKKEGTQIPFIIKSKATGKIVGSTRIGDIDIVNRNVEIGWTWITPELWRSPVNTESKLLMLQYCFEVLKVYRVQFSVSGLNIRSQKAIERLGAIKEGTFRKHRVKKDGTIHDNVYYSILDTEWDKVKDHLIFLLEKKY
ncbi:GNAT family N-acetyltransferase [Cytobacillus praedii]|uniref:GNAT family N-acetyltransferase n=1 Tax=Cytobacillus praedii TaxID=1742358 RepID=UPI00070E5101|nr:GNAT family protein [Cytobacillus praedii]